MVFLRSEKARSELYKLTGVTLCTPFCAIVLNYFLSDSIAISFVLAIKLFVSMILFCFGQRLFDYSVDIMYNLDKEELAYGS